MPDHNEIDHLELLALTSEIVTSHVIKNAVSAADLPRLVEVVFATLNRLGGTPDEAPADELKPAVNPRRSVTPDYIVCLEDGKKLKMLKRHLRTSFNLSPEQYRQRWNLPADYPMVAPNYAARRRELAMKIGLGRKSTA
ncbi:MucR family transcriptional regulator [Emcibacter sp. SYSU 3D8]|uniref:MucR family transcriptional regulator n=1 Tax=Emcibacter sp. SYSU 3D8 TaxID=3133969 RepID=UPI0031FE6E1C